MDEYSSSSTARQRAPHPPPPAPGPSGAGKTTLVNVLAGRTQPSRGVVALNGQPLDKKLRRNIAYVMQNDILLTNLTVRVRPSPNSSLPGTLTQSTRTHPSAPNPQPPTLPGDADLCGSAAYARCVWLPREARARRCLDTAARPGKGVPTRSAACSWRSMEPRPLFSASLPALDVSLPPTLTARPRLQTRALATTSSVECLVASASASALVLRCWRSQPSSSWTSPPLAWTPPRLPCSLRPCAILPPTKAAR